MQLDAIAASAQVLGAGGKWSGSMRHRKRGGVDLLDGDHEGVSEAALVQDLALDVGLKHARQVPSGQQLDGHILRRILPGICGLGYHAKGPLAQDSDLQAQQAQLCKGNVRWLSYPCSELPHHCVRRAPTLAKEPWLSRASWASLEAWACCACCIWAWFGRRPLAAARSVLKTEDSNWTASGSCSWPVTDTVECDCCW